MSSNKSVPASVSVPSISGPSIFKPSSSEPMSISEPGSVSETSISELASISGPASISDLASISELVLLIQACWAEEPSRRPTAAHAETAVRALLQTLAGNGLAGSRGGVAGNGMAGDALAGSGSAGSGLAGSGLAGSYTPREEIAACTAMLVHSGASALHTTDSTGATAAYAAAGGSDVSIGVNKAAAVPSVMQTGAHSPNLFLLLPLHV